MYAEADGVVVAQDPVVFYRDACEAGHLLMIEQQGGPI